MQARFTGLFLEYSAASTTSNTSSTAVQARFTGLVLKYTALLQVLLVLELAQYYYSLLTWRNKQSKHLQVLSTNDFVDFTFNLFSLFLYL